MAHRKPALRIAHRTACLLLAPGLALADAPAAPADEDRFGRVIARIEAFTDHELKEFYLRCTRDAMRGGMGAGEIALCSTGYELLLKRAFGGDFIALLDWRRAGHKSREPAPPSPF